MTAAEKFSKFADTDLVRQSLKRKSVRGVLFMANAAGMDFIIRLGSIFLLARLLSPSDFGLLAMVLSVTAIADQFSEFGLSMATIQCRELKHQQVSNLFWINVGAGCLISLLICGLAPVIAEFYRNPGLVPITFAISTTFIWAGLTVQHQALLSRQMKQAHLATIGISASLLSQIAAVVLALNHFGAWALAWREVARAFLVAVGTWLFCRWIPGLPRRNVDIGGLLRYGSHITLSQVAIVCAGQFDRLIIGRFFGASPLGMYRQAQQLLLAPLDHVRSAVHGVARPSLSILQSDSERYRRYYQRIALVTGFATMPLGLFVAIYAKEITHVLLGPKWIAATIFLRIFGLVTFLKPTLDTSAVVMLTCGLSKRLLVLSLAYNALFVAFMFAGISGGAEGVALANVATVVLMMFPVLYFALRHTPVTVTAFFRAITTPVIASVSMAGVLLGFRDLISGYGMAVSLFSGLGVGAVVYSAVVFLLPQGRREVMALISAVLGSFQRHRPAGGTLEGTEKLDVGSTG